MKNILTSDKEADKIHTARVHDFSVSVLCQTDAPGEWNLKANKVPEDRAPRPGVKGQCQPKREGSTAPKRERRVSTTTHRGRQGERSTSPKVGVGTTTSKGKMSRRTFTTKQREEQKTKNKNTFLSVFQKHTKYKEKKNTIKSEKEGQQKET